MLNTCCFLTAIKTIITDKGVFYKNKCRPKTKEVCILPYLHVLHVLIIEEQTCKMNFKCI